MHFKVSTLLVYASRQFCVLARDGIGECVFWRDNIQSGFQLVLALLNDTRVTDKLVFFSPRYGES